MISESINDRAYFDRDGCLRYKEDLAVRKVQFKKGRQGRSAETRLRRRKEKYFQNKQKNIYYSHDVCKVCKLTDFIVVDEKDSTVFCINCGLVLEELLNSKQQTFDQPTKSKPYERVVHYQQRLSSVQGTDPLVSEEDVRMIEEFLVNNPCICGVSLYYAGWQSIKTAVKELGLNPVYASRWVQIRSRFNIQGIRHEVAIIPDRIINKLKLRYILVSRAFDQKLNELITSSTQSNNNKDLSRKNMLNLNYVIPVLIRMDCEETFRETACFFPQNRSQYQPALNNQRMKIIIDYCKQHFTGNYTYKDEYIELSWEYKPLTSEDILNYFILYR